MQPEAFKRQHVTHHSSESDVANNIWTDLQFSLLWRSQLVKSFLSQLPQMPQLGLVYDLNVFLRATFSAPGTSGASETGWMIRTERKWGIATTLLATANDPATVSSEFHSWVWYNAPSKLEMMLRLLSFLVPKEWKASVGHEDPFRWIQHSASTGQALNISDRPVYQTEPPSLARHIYRPTKRPRRSCRSIGLTGP